jgi:hypothetical protein
MSKNAIDRQDIDEIVHLKTELDNAHKSIRLKQAELETLQIQLDKKLEGLKSMKRTQRNALRFLFGSFEAIVGIAWLFSVLLGGFLVNQNMQSQDMAGVLLLWIALGSFMFLSMKGIQRLFGDGYVQVKMKLGLLKAQDLNAEQFDRLLLNPSK